MSSFVQAINGEMKLSDENKKKSLIIDRIDSYVAVCDDKYPHIKEVCHKNEVKSQSMHFFKNKIYIYII